EGAAGIHLILGLTAPRRDDLASPATELIQPRSHFHCQWCREGHWLLIRLLTVIGEAANKVSADTQGEHPEIAWGEIVAFRNRLVHGYFDIDMDKVWDAITTDVPELVRLLEPLVLPENP
ncbi:MAG: DUF86 domain-containing protein, partial [Chloroflexi bacterium]|nr:DUF86 domain-containing protein [Chloroflexota bacterium]